jgi:ATP-dependent RNA helicase DeaD
LDLVKQKKMRLDNVAAVVLDEADEMLDMGFAEDIDALLSATPKERQTMLFSATMPPRIEEIASRHLRKPVRIQVAREKAAEGEEAKVRQTAYIVKREHKAMALGRILDVERPTSAIIFCRTRTEADQLTEMLSHRDFKPLSLHGGLSQEQRDSVMKRFRSGAIELLIATDIAARGLDIAHLSHVINFDVPTQPEAYVHRIGRVGRAGRAGVAITLCAPGEQWALSTIERESRQTIQKAEVPSVKDLRAARLERMRTKIREMLIDPKVPDELRGLVGELEAEFPLKDIAIAVTRLLSEPNRADDEKEIPSAKKDQKTERSEKPRAGGPRERQRAGGRQTTKGMAKVFFGIGRDAGVAPRDLVGAIANEAGINGKDLGLIDLTDRFALVEVPQDMADYIVETMQGARIKGRKVNVRADRGPKKP